MSNKKTKDLDQNKKWLFCECLGNGVSPEEEKEIFTQLLEMRKSFTNPMDFVINVLERVNLTPSVEKKLLLIALTGKLIGFFSG